MSCENDEFIDEVSSAIAFQLNQLLPNGLLEEEHHSDVELYLQNLLAQSENFMTKTDLREGLSTAARKWKETKQDKDSMNKKLKGSKCATFSLLDQLQAGGFAMPVDLQGVLEQTTVDSNLLDQLEEIKYLEDLISEWNKVMSLLARGLRDENDASILNRILKLYRTWFDQARSSDEYLSFQYDICQTLSITITGTISTQESYTFRDPDFYFALLQSWHDIFVDIMQRSKYIEETASVLEDNLFQWLHFEPPQEESEVPRLDIVSPVQYLALLDPHAGYFGRWIHHVSNRRLVMLLEQKTLLPILFRRASSILPMNSNDQATDRTRELDECLRVHSLVILSRILQHARLSGLPWQSITGEMPTTSSQLQSQDDALDRANVDSQFIHHAPAYAQVTGMITLYCKALEEYEGIPQWAQHFCFEAIETLMDGIFSIWGIVPSEIIVGLLSRRRMNTGTKDDIVQRVEGLLYRYDSDRRGSVHGVLD